jgi:hypothetical protein
MDFDQMVQTVTTIGPSPHSSPVRDCVAIHPGNKIAQRTKIICQAMGSI